jgi:hypothetical protein
MRHDKGAQQQPKESKCLSTSTSFKQGRMERDLCTHEGDGRHDGGINLTETNTNENKTTINDKKERSFKNRWEHQVPSASDRGTRS